MKIGVDYVSSQDVRGGKDDKAKKLGKFDYVPKGGLSPQPVVKPSAPEAQIAPIKKPDIKVTEKPAGDPEVFIQKPATEETKPAVIGQKKG